MQKLTNSTKMFQSNYSQLKPNSQFHFNLSIYFPWKPSFQANSIYNSIYNISMQLYTVVFDQITTILTLYIIFLIGWRLGYRVNLKQKAQL